MVILDQNDLLHLNINFISLTVLMQLLKVTVLEDSSIIQRSSIIAL